MVFSSSLMPDLHITDLEAAINYWRERSPTTAGHALAPATASLAEVYACMIAQRRTTWPSNALTPAAQHAWLAWYDTQPDTPCIAICSTSQGDAICKGCGRSFEEVQLWPGMDPFAKRAVWRRITQAGTAWRFTRYAERAR